MTQSILVVEDDRDIRESLVEVLQEAGYAVIGALDGLDALQKLRGLDELPSLVLLDLTMPRMNGIELRAQLAKVPRWSAIPIVIITADARHRSKDDVVLKKPMKLADLLAAVERAMACA